MNSATHAALPHDDPIHPDARLVARVRNGDDDAFAEIVTRFTPALLAFARRLVGNHHDAEDIVQDAFVRADRALRGDERPIALSAWLHTIVRNRALDRLRQARPSAPFDDALSALLHDPIGEPGPAAERREALGDVVRGIQALPDRQRAALVLHEFEGVSHSGIGRRLGVSEAASKTLLHRARAGLRSHALAA